MVPSAYRVANMLINRIENNQTGDINGRFWVDVPKNRYDETVKLVETLGENAVKNYPFHQNTHSVTSNTLELVLNRTWRPQLTVTGFEGLSIPS